MMRSDTIQFALSRRMLTGLINLTPFIEKIKRYFMGVKISIWSTHYDFPSYIESDPGIVKEGYGEDSEKARVISKA